MKKKKNNTAEAERESRISGLLDIITPTVLDFDKDEFSMGDARCRVKSVFGYPSEGAPGWLALFTEQPNCLVSMHCHKTDVGELLKSIQNTIDQERTKTYAQNAKETDVDAAEDVIEKARDLANSIRSSNATAVNLTINYMVYSDTEEDLTKTCQQIDGSLTGNQFMVRDLSYMQEDALKSMLPICMNAFGDISGLDMTTSAFAGGIGFFPAVGLNDPTGTFLGSDDSKNPVFLDLWSREGGRMNSNLLVLGITGSGKSTTLKDLVFDRMAEGDKILILDAEKEYLDLANVMHGNVIDGFGENSSRINPLQLRDIPEVFDDPNKSQAEIERILSDPYFKGSMSMHMEFLKTWFALYIPALAQPENAIEMSALESCLYEMYRTAGITERTDPRTMRNDQFPIMSDLYKAIAQVVATHELGGRPVGDITPYDHLLAYLQPAVNGADRFVFNGPTTVNLDRALNVINVFTLLKAPANVKNAQFHNICTYAWLFLTKNRKEHTIMLVDEAHLFITKDSSVTFKFLHESMRRCRKYNSSLWIASQNVADFLGKGGSDVAELEGMLNNPAIRFVMNEKSTDISYLKHLFNISEKEEQLITGAVRGQGLLMAGNNRYGIKVEVNPDTLAIISKSGGQ